MSYVKQPLQVPLPFLRRQTGLGDAVAQGTHAVGIQPCAPCKKRQAYLNRLMQFRPIRRQG